MISAIIILDAECGLQGPLSNSWWVGWLGVEVASFLHVWVSWGDVLCRGSGVVWRSCMFREQFALVMLRRGL